MKLRAPHWIGMALLALLLCTGAVLTWTLNTTAGAHWALARAQSALAGKLTLGASRGTLAGPLELDDLRYRDADAGIDFSARRIRLELAAAALLRFTLHVETLDAQGVRVALSDAKEKPVADDTPFSLEPPLDILLDRFTLRDAQVSRAGELLVSIDSALLAANWTGSGVEVRQLDVQSPQGEAHFAAQVARRDYFQGKGEGRFRWRAGERDYAGRFTARTQERLALIELQLSAPVTAKLAAQLGQDDSLPWRFALELPAFDPRERLDPGTSLRSLGARLQGEGTAARGNATGTVQLNGDVVQVEKLAFARRAEDLDLDALLRLASGANSAAGATAAAGARPAVGAKAAVGASDTRSATGAANASGARGQLQARGTVHLAQQPLNAKLNLQWRDVVLPADLAGQVLHSQGRIDFEGSASAYAAHGSVTLGPPRRPADIRLRVAGGTRAIELQQFDIVQPAGRLAAAGNVQLQPQLGWQVNAKATRFDPGAFAAAWPGSLDFALASTGKRSDAGIEASLLIDRLAGKLRNRAVAGTADLQLAADATLSGALDVRSGGSRVRVTGRGSRGGAGSSGTGSSTHSGTGGDTSATALVDVATLDDWLPGSAGSLHARLDATGRWPELRIVGNANGSDLQMNAQRVAKLALEFDVRRPQHPEGSVTIGLEGAATTGFQFSRIDLTAKGSEQAHDLTLHAQGTPVSADLRLQGALQSGAWQGDLQHLVLDAKDVTQLQLTQPVHITYGARAATVSEACFANRDMRLCFAGESNADRSLHAKCSLQNLPLALPVALLAPELALVVRGTLEGAGEMRRDAAGLLSGNAKLQSTSGEVAEKPLDEGDATRRLIAWNDLALDAELAGTAANAKLRARLDDTGSLQGELAATGVNTASTGLRGSVSMDLPSIAVLEVFAPQLANVQGKLALQARVAGTLDAPSITGSLAGTELAMELPDLGLKLHDGRISIEPQGAASAPLRIAGEIGSGKGKLTISGTATTAGVARLAVKGDDFLAADIPGVRVNVSPDLDFERNSERMTLTGDVRVQGADVNLEKLPRGNRAQAASSDVVILDDTAEREKQAQSVPLIATLAVDLGEKVKLVGFGLDATVAGQLNVRERPGEPTTGSGEIRVAGTYKAYGQDLTIRQGQLLYAQTPLDNPRLAIVAVRTIDTVTAGLRVAGTAQAPILTVFSDPVMGQSSALSYLVAGKPLDQIGSGDGESDALQSAARSLGTAAGGLLAKNVGKRLGVDELGIKDSAALGGAALTVGQYLSPRLYLSYGVGLFTPGEVITLRYRLARGLSLEAENAAQNSRAGVQYRVER